MTPELYRFGAFSKSNNYPNPGYLGLSSHAKNFDHIPSPVEHENDRFQMQTHPSTINTATPTSTITTANNSSSNTRRRGNVRSDNQHALQGEDDDIFVDEAHINYGVQIIEGIRNSMDISSCIKLVEMWSGMGINFALAGIFAKKCVETTRYIFESLGSRSGSIGRSSNGVAAAAARVTSAQDQYTHDEDDGDSDVIKVRNVSKKSLHLFVLPHAYGKNLDV